MNLRREFFALLLFTFALTLNLDLFFGKGLRPMLKKHNFRRLPWRFSNAKSVGDRWILAANPRSAPNAANPAACARKRPLRLPRQKSEIGNQQVV
jgi:hypothetical protein